MSCWVTYQRSFPEKSLQIMGGGRGQYLFSKKVGRLFIYFRTKFTGRKKSKLAHPEEGAGSRKIFGDYKEISKLNFLSK